MKSYPKYKASGNGILEMKIPEHWEMKRLKYISEVTNSNVDKHSLEGEEKVLLCNYTDVYYNEYIDDSIQFMQATATSEEIRKFTLNAGDVLITKDSEEPDDIAVSAYVKSPVKGLLCGYHLALIRPYEKKIDGKYLFRAFKTSGINEQFQVDAQGITRYGLSKYGIDNSLFPVPPLEEQQAIASFLDQKTSKIDNLVSIKEKQIELLKEERTAIINQAVTKGLNANVKMKDSCIEWLGEIPEHWSQGQLRRVLHKASNGTTANQVDEITEYPVTRIETISTGKINWDKTGYIEKKDADVSYHLNKYDILLSHINSLDYVGNCAIYEEDKILIHGMNLLRLQPNNIIYPYYLLYYLKSFCFKRLIETEAKHAINQVSIPMSALKSLAIVYPSFLEQKGIVQYLDQQTVKIDKSISDAEKQIELLKEYRTALISEAVTGKIDVRPPINTDKHG